MSNHDEPESNLAPNNDVDNNQEDGRVRKRQEQALMFEKYLEESGLSLSF